jgi:hypothetical protein
LRYVPAKPTEEYADIFVFQMSVTDGGAVYAKEAIREVIVSFRLVLTFKPMVDAVVIDDSSVFHTAFEIDENLFSILN